MKVEASSRAIGKATVAASIMITDGTAAATAITAMIGTGAKTGPLHLNTQGSPTRIPCVSSVRLRCYQRMPKVTGTMSACLSPKMIRW
jgi:hypothetical protein